DLNEHFTLGEQGTIGDADDASGHTDSDGGTGTLDQGDSHDESETDSLTVHTVDPTTGNTDDYTVVSTDASNSHDSVKDDGSFTDNAGPSGNSDSFTGDAATILGSFRHRTATYSNMHRFLAASGQEAVHVAVGGRAVAETAQNRGGVSN